MRDKKIGPLRVPPKAGWPHRRAALAYDDEIDNWKLSSTSATDGEEGGRRRAGDFSASRAWAPAPSARAMFEHGASYVCEHSVGANVTCDFKSGKIIPQQPVPREQMSKALAEGKTALLENFVPTRRGVKFKAFRLGRQGRQGRLRVRAAARCGGATGEAEAAAAKKKAALSEGREVPVRAGRATSPLRTVSGGWRSGLPA